MCGLLKLLCSDTAKYPSEQKKTNRFVLQSHFSIKRAGILLGIGADNVIEVLADERYHYFHTLRELLCP